MKKFFGIITVLSVLLMLPGVSFSYNNNYPYSYVPRPYVSGQLGAAILTDSDWNEPGYEGTLEYDPGFASGFAAGLNFGAFRIEGELGYQTNNIDKMSVYDDSDEYSYGKVSSGDISARSFLGNVYIDFINFSPVTPFITAGVGMATIEINDFGGYDYDDTVLAYQIGAGLAFAVNPHFTIDLKYRYFDTENPDFEGTEAEFASHNVYCGFRFNF